MQNANLERELAELRREYEERLRELELEKSSLSDQLLKRNAELEAILKELQDLMDSKLGLELEIAAYRKLLEGEENKYVYHSGYGWADFLLPSPDVAPCHMPYTDSKWKHAMIKDDQLSTHLPI